MLHKNYMVAVVASIFAMVLFTGTSLFSQNQPPNAAQQQQQAPAVELDDKTVDKFVSATREISKIRTEYSQKMQGTKDKGQQQELQKEAQGEMIEALNDEGLDPQTYNSIVQSIKQDPELQKEVHEKIEGK
ncbi:MAG: DUF4168 domain-containing protein [Spirochaetota bacterium]